MATTTPEQLQSMLGTTKAEAVWDSLKYRHIPVGTPAKDRGELRFNPNYKPLSPFAHETFIQYKVSPELVYGQIDIAQQEQAPNNPGIRKATFSTHGIPIPVSVGRRAITGNVVDASDISPTLVGAHDYWIEYKVPYYASGPE